MTVVIKVGTESLENFETSSKVSGLISDISMIKHFYHEKVILVTSGAVGFGKKATKGLITNKQVLASVGWGDLLEQYRKKFSANKIIPAGFLVTHADIEDYPERRKIFVDTVSAALESENILPIINENDPFSTEEMQALQRGADNDKNALLISKLFQARILAIMTNTNGVYSDREDKRTRIPRIGFDCLTDSVISHMCGGKSNGGTGGMESKLKVAREAASCGIETYIFNGEDSGLLDYFSRFDEVESPEGGTVVSFERKKL